MYPRKKTGTRKVANQNAFVRTRFEIEALRKEKMALQERYRCLRIESATLESLGRIAQEARKCGLVPRPEAAAPGIVMRTGAPRPSIALPAAGAGDARNDISSDLTRPWRSRGSAAEQARTQDGRTSQLRGGHDPSRPEPRL